MIATAPASALTAFAAEVGDTGPVSVVGGQSRWEVGGALASSARVISAPAGVVSYEPAEMTVRVRAGTTTAELATALESAGQRVGLPERGGTVGGAIAVAENRVDRLATGTVRDAVLQVTYVDEGGNLVTGGGPVVKNVSGFNIPKLLVGSLGTLGLMAEFVLRTNPIPEVSAWLRADDADPAAVLDAVLAPACVLYDGATVWVQLEGHGADVEAETAALGRVGSFHEASGQPDLPANRWSLRPSDVFDLDAGALGAYVASVGVGTVWAERSQPERSPDAASVAVATRMKQLFDPSGRLNPGRTLGW